MVQDTNKYFPNELPLKYTPKKNGFGQGNLDSDVRGLLVWCLIHSEGDKEMKQFIYKELCHYVKVHQIEGEEKLTEKEI